ncbi:hypothetical protein [Mastigocladopsis repens]|nr:hypothetical protein [Mastigocladopsis repens]
MHAYKTLFIYISLYEQKFKDLASVEQSSIGILAGLFRKNRILVDCANLS